MAYIKLDIEKFDWKNDFNLWEVKMEGLLVHQGLKVTIESDPWANNLLNDEDFKEKIRKVHSTIILSLKDEVLREVLGDKSASDI